MCGGVGTARIGGSGAVLELSAQQGVECHRCGSEDDPRFAHYRRVIGLLVLARIHSQSGYFCRRCRWRLFAEWQTLTLLLGWWGVLALLFRNPFALVANTWAVIGAPLGASSLDALTLTDLQRQRGAATRAVALLDRLTPPDDIFRGFGIQAYVSEFEVFAADYASSIPYDDIELIEFAVDVAADPQSEGTLVRNLVTAGYLWARFEQVEPPATNLVSSRRDWRAEVEQTMTRSRVGRPLATGQVEVGRLKWLIDTHFDEALPSRAQRDRFRAFRDAQVNRAFDLGARGAEGDEAFERLRGDPRYADQMIEAKQWASQLIDWGLAIGLRHAIQSPMSAS
jgi:hypothetical protein